MKSIKHFFGLQAKSVLRYLLSLLLAVFLMPVSAAEKQTPNISLSNAGPYGVAVGELNFTRPSVYLRLEDKSGRMQDVGKYYQLTFYVRGFENTAQDKLPRKGTTVYTEDAVTGTVVTQLQGKITLGSKSAGSVDVVVVARPRAAYAGEWNTVQTSFTINLRKLSYGISAGFMKMTKIAEHGSGVAHYAQTFSKVTTMQVHRNSIVAAPVLHIDAGSEIDTISKYFNVVWKSGNENVAKFSSDMSQLIIQNGGRATVTATGTPKLGGVIEPFTVTYTVDADIKGISSAVLETFDVDTLMMGDPIFHTNSTVPLYTRVVDDLGNDISGLYSFAYTQTKADYRLDGGMYIRNAPGAIWLENGRFDKYVLQPGGIKGDTSIVEGINEFSVDVKVRPQWFFNGFTSFSSDVLAALPVPAAAAFKVRVHKIFPIVEVIPEEYTIPMGYWTNIDPVFRYLDPYFRRPIESTQTSGMWYQAVYPKDTEEYLQHVNYSDNNSSWGNQKDKVFAIYGKKITTESLSVLYNVGSGNTNYYANASGMLKIKVVDQIDAAYESGLSGTEFTWPVDDWNFEEPRLTLRYKGQNIFDKYTITETLEMRSLADTSKVIAAGAYLNDDWRHYSQLLMNLYTGKSPARLVVKIHCKGTPIGNNPSPYKDMDFQYVVNTYQRGNDECDYKIVTGSNDMEYQATMSAYGKMVFTKAGRLQSGRHLYDSPGVMARFGRIISDNGGSNDDNDGWTVAFDEKNGLYAVGDKTVFDAEHDNLDRPVRGTFYEFRPQVNGFLTVDGLWLKNNGYVLYCNDDGTSQTITGTGGRYEQQLPYALLSGRTYYLYNDGGDDGTQEPLRLYGYNYEPAYVRSAAATEPVHEAAAFLGGFPSRPRLIERGAQNHDVTFSLAAYVENGNAERTWAENGTVKSDYVFIGQNADSVLYIMKYTDGLHFDETLFDEHDNNTYNQTFKNGIEVSGQVKSRGRINQWNTADVSKKAFYSLRVLQLPTYSLTMIDDSLKSTAESDEDKSLVNSFFLNVGDELTTRTAPTAVTVTVGGWQEGKDRPYVKGSDKNSSAKDSWKAVSADGVGKDNSGAYTRLVDGFSLFSVGTQDPRNECGRKYTDMLKNGSTERFKAYDKVPCRGTYMKIEPCESGVFLVYLLQNGCIGYNGSGKNSDIQKKDNNQISFRPVFIVDETGEPVAMDNEFGIRNDYVSTNTANMSHLGYFTNGIYRTSYYDPDIKAYWKDEKNVGDDQGWVWHDDWNELATAADRKRFEDQWKRHDATDIEEIVKLDNGGYVVPSKAYVRYTFDVKAGKTYYVLAEGSKISFCGFSFAPEGYPNQKERPHETITLSQKNNYTVSGEHQNVKVVTDLNFVKDRWTSICLPFSMSTSKFAKTFGSDASLVTFDKVDNKGTVHFVQHCEMMIEAGKPYLIRPAKDISALTVDSVTIEAGVSCEDKYVSSGGYTFKGTFEPALMHKGSYIMAWSASRGNKLMPISKDAQINGFRAWFDKDATAEAPLGTLTCRLAGEAGTEMEQPLDVPTAIDGITSDSKTEPSAVYNISGQRVNAADGQPLPAGVYIKGGKKIVVR